MGSWQGLTGGETRQRRLSRQSRVELIEIRFDEIGVCRWLLGNRDGRDEVLEIRHRGISPGNKVMAERIL